MPKSLVIKSFQMAIENAHWKWNFFNGYFSPIVVEILFPYGNFPALLGNLDDFKRNKA